MKNSDFLREVKSKIASPANWTQRYYALNKDGQTVLSSSAAACKWCLMGAVHAVSRHRIHNFEAATKMLYFTAHEMFDTYTTDVNDRLGFESVHELLDEAIRRFEEQEKK